MKRTVLFATMIVAVICVIEMDVSGCGVAPTACMDFWVHRYSTSYDKYCVRVDEFLGMNASSRGYYTGPCAECFPPGIRSEDFGESMPAVYRLADWQHGIKRWYWNFGDGEDYYEGTWFTGWDRGGSDQYGAGEGTGSDGFYCELNLNGCHWYSYDTVASWYYTATLVVEDDDAYEGMAAEDQQGWEQYDILAYDLDIDAPYDCIGVGQLMPVSLSFSPSGCPVGYCLLHAQHSFGWNSSVKVWADEDRTTLLIPYANPPIGDDWSYGWPTPLVGADQNLTVWVEATGAGPVALNLKFVINGDEELGVESLTFGVVSLEMINPSGNPKSSSKAEEGVNEFTFSPINSICYIRCEAQVSDPDFEDDITWSISPGIEGSPLEWGDYSGEVWTPGDNKGPEVWIRFLGLPDGNHKFGLKTVTASVLGIQKENDIEIFFDKTAMNHYPIVGTEDWPNWLYYWLQTIEDPIVTPAPDIKYVGSYGTQSPFCENEIWVGDESSVSLPVPYVTGNLAGIDLFAWSMRHEEQHCANAKEFWNNDRMKYNSTYAGQGTEETEHDKDLDRLPNNREDGFFPPAGDGIYDWEQKNTERVGRHTLILNDEEDYICIMHNDVRGDHEKDWANPGMQHGHNDVYDD